MSKPLTHKQPHMLYALVRHANSHGGLLPTGEELAEILRISVRNASERKRRLIKLFPEDFIVGNDKKIRINEEVLCTFQNTSLYLIELENLTTNEQQYNTDGLLPYKVAEKLFFDIHNKEAKSEFKKKLKILCSSGYLKKINGDYVQLGNKYLLQKKYLLLLAGKKDHKK